MATQVRQRSPGATRQSAVLPVPLRWLSLGLVVIVALYVALPVAMALDRESTIRSVLTERPDLDGRELELAVGIALLYAAVVHAAGIALATWLVIKVRARRRWARIALTVYLVVVTAGSAVSWMAGPQFAWAVLSTAVVHLTMLGLLWLPAASRRHLDVVVSRDEISGAATR